MLSGCGKGVPLVLFGLEFLLNVEEVLGTIVGDWLKRPQYLSCWTIRTVQTCFCVYMWFRDYLFSLLLLNFFKKVLSCHYNCLYWLYDYLPLHTDHVIMQWPIYMKQPKGNHFVFALMRPQWLSLWLYQGKAEIIKQSWLKFQECVSALARCSIQQQ